ncbi:PREDICTED: UPF0577 protein KIAA1324-like homolog isoform X2 [Priapulus caudatus]|uniref:UPF0577 protein KIAA1324-like homolog isoform X2 n=1 Tax=Priapulus caudatus TaxID=37621 RepID=A0ABM1DUR2_PRICU|nr:PREDICTED: UPF0577 protein KIAA1324-like homolog isoform X2 [Priapulus caudatus]
MHFSNWRMKTIAVLISLLTALNGLESALPTCKESDFHYEFTECDASGGRWRVQVPKPGVCNNGTPKPPVRGRDCSFSCEPGQYLDVQGDQDCHGCPKGTYSLGGGVRFESWDELPDGFRVVSDSFESAMDDDSWDGMAAVMKDENCTLSSWQPRGDFISSTADLCSQSLVYTARLVKPGKVTYTYQFTDSDVIFNFLVQNDECRSYTDSAKWPRHTGEGEWNTAEVLLKSGQNILSWKTIGINFDTKRTPKPVLIKRIEISGVAYTSECTPCANGTFADAEGFTECKACPVNTFSHHGADACTPCSDKEYAPEEAASCVARPWCTKRDYFETHTPCDENKETQVMYKWIEPNICLDEAEGAAKLPTSGSKTECGPCNPGMQYVNGSVCEFCPTDQFSDGKRPCQPCPASTAPDYGLNYKWWNSMPPYMSADCFTLDTTGCATPEGWQLAGDRVHSGLGHADDVYLVLSLQLNGFRSARALSKLTEVGRVSFVFELHCTADCYLYFIQDKSTVIESWSGNQGKQQFSCIPCPPGNYIDSNTTRCVECAPGTVVQEAEAYDIDSCKPCGPGTLTKDHLSCYSDCKLTLPGGNMFDFSPLQGYHTLQGATLFTASGTKYFHMFNLSLCGSPDKHVVHCTNNVTVGTENVEEEETGEGVDAPICRTTVIPQKSHDGDYLLSAQSVSLGEYLVAVTDQPKFQSMSAAKAPLDVSKDLGSVHFYFHSVSATQACPDGRRSVISLHCNESYEAKGQIRMPGNCPDGTCDGCTFHFHWITKYACPICADEDYNIMKGECKNGKQEIHRLKASECIEAEAPQITTQECSVLPMQVQIVIAVAIGVGVLLVGLLVYFWKKNRKLEYKYSRLMQGSSGKEGELPAAETCAIDDDEEEQYDSIEFSNSQGNKLLNKLSKSFKGKESFDNPFESIKLSEKTPVLS